MQRVEDLVPKIRGVVGSDNEVLLAYLFGSQSEGRATEHSDFDIGILHCGDSLIKVVEVQKKVVKELKLNEDEVDVVDISRAPVRLQINIAKGLKLLDRGNYERKLIQELIKSPGTRVMKDASLIFDQSIIDFLYSMLQKVREETAYLKEEILVKGAEVVVREGTLLRAMTWSLHKITEMMFDTCRHLVSVKALGAAETYVDFPRLLSKHNIIPLSLAEALGEAAKLRTMLTYGDVDHRRLFSKAREIVEHTAPGFQEWVLGLLE